MRPFAAVEWFLLSLSRSHLVAEFALLRIIPSLGSVYITSCTPLVEPSGGLPLPSRSTLEKCSYAHTELPA